MLRRILKALQAILFSHVIVRLGSLILVPLCLKYWRAGYYGEYLTLFAAVSYLTSLDFGMQQAAVNRQTQAFAKGDLAEYRSVQHSAMAFYLLLASALTVLAALGAWLLPFSRWIGLRLTPPAIAGLVIVLLAIYVMWSMPMRLVAATFQTMGNLSRSQWVANVQQVLVVLLSAAILIRGGGMLAMAFVQVATVAAVSIFLLFDIHRHTPHLFPGTREAKLVVLKDLAHPSLLFALLLVGNLIAYQGSVLLTSAVLGGLAVVLLSVSKAVVDVIRQALYSIGLALCPDFARMEARGEFEKLRRVHWFVMVATGAITLATVGTLWYEGPQIIEAWTRGRMEADPMLLRLFLVLLAFQTPWAASSTIATSTNRHRTQAIGYFVSAVIGIGVAAALMPRLDVWAVPVGLTLGEAVGCYHFVIKATCRIIGEPYAAFAMRFWLGFGLVAIAALAAGWGIHCIVSGPMLLRWGLSGLSTLSLALACTWIAWLTPQDRALLLPRLQPVLLWSETKT
jgi:O-antigen/teichoic acid export membrane protein